MNVLISKDKLMNKFAEFVKRANNSDFAPVPTWNDAVSLVESKEVEVKCKNCVLHCACAFESGLGEDGFCSQWMSDENG